MKLETMVTPNRILDMIWDFARSRTLATAVELDIFTKISNGNNTVKQIAEAAGCSQRGTEMLLNALAGLELLTKNKIGNYHLAPDSEQFLVSDKPRFLGGMSLHTSQLSEIWRNLTESVKSGKPHLSTNDQQTGEEYFPNLVKSLFTMNYPAAKYTASNLKGKDKEILDVLDVAAGSGVWGIGIAQEFQDAKITFLDFPAVVNISREFADRFGIGNRSRYIEDDLRNVDFGKDCYDLIILGHICHGEGENNTKKLLNKSYKALRTGGYLLIAEFLANNERTGPAVPLLFALNMLLNTTDGNVYTIKEFQKWLTASGFKKIDLLDQAPSGSPLILAIK